MNKYQKAFYKVYHLLKPKLSFSEFMEGENALDTLQELVEKATPKKKKINYVVGLLRCPTCGKDVISEWYKYCPHCGQKIEGEEDDWWKEIKERFR